MNEPSLLAALQASAFAENLAPDVLRQLASAARWRRVPSGSILFREGQRNNSFYVVHSGSIALDMCLPARGCKRLLSVGPGDIVAWSALLGEGTMTATATALEDTELIEFSGADLQRMCAADPLVGYPLMRQMCQALSQRLVATRLQLLDLFHWETGAMLYD